jgi:hypothetical protein
MIIKRYLIIILAAMFMSVDAVAARLQDGSTRQRSYSADFQSKAGLQQRLETELRQREENVAWREGEVAKREEEQEIERESLAIERRDLSDREYAARNLESVAVQRHIDSLKMLSWMQVERGAVETLHEVVLTQPWQVYAYDVKEKSNGRRHRIEYRQVPQAQPEQEEQKVAEKQS